MANSDSKVKFKKAIDFKLLSRVLNYVKPYRSLFLGALGITLLLSVFAISRPLLVQYTIDKFISAKDEGMISQMSLVLLLILLTESFLQYINMTLTGRIGQNIIKELRVSVYKHVLRFSNRYFDQHPVGLLVTRTISDIEALSDVFSQGFIVILGDMVTLLVFVVTMFIINWQLTLVVLLTIPLLLLATYYFKKGVKSTFNLIRNAVALMNTFVQEHIQGMKQVQLFAREDQEYEKFREINEQHKQANVKSIWYYSIFFPIVEILASVAISMLILYSGWQSERMHTSPGEFTFFVMLTNMLFRPIRMLADRLNTLQMGMVSSERVFKILDTDDFISDSGFKVANEIKGELKFDKVWFAYKDEEYVLKELSFSIPHGKTLAIVGATGAGKTSIINLISRFYEINKGDILIDNLPIKDYRLESLRSAVNVVMQDVFLFSDSIKNNITLYDEALTDSAIESAAIALGAHEFIMNLPGGYSFNVMERGASLSSGQRQLIAILRAYINNPSILILDEATSSVDSMTEQVIQKAIEKLTQNRTSIIIAHRLSTIQHADEIIVLDKGEIVEKGDFSFLQQKKGYFYQLYATQFKDNYSHSVD